MFPGRTGGVWHGRSPAVQQPPALGFRLSQGRTAQAPPCGTQGPLSLDLTGPGVRHWPTLWEAAGQKGPSPGIWSQPAWVQVSAL